MEDLFLFLMMVLLFGIIGGLIYKYRSELRRWLKDPKYGSSWQPTRKTYLMRKIEDASEEITDIEKRDVETVED